MNDWRQEKWPRTVSGGMLARNREGFAEKL